MIQGLSLMVHTNESFHLDAQPARNSNQVSNLPPYRKVTNLFENVILDTYIFSFS